eukprot:1783189-Rhodomonas_salina.1
MLRLPERLTPWGAAYNSDMSKLRVSIENEYATVGNAWRFLGAGSRLQLGNMSVGKFFVVASFIDNCRAIQQGNQVQAQF